MITNHFHTFLLLIIHSLLNFTTIIGQHSSELESGVEIRCFENERQALLKYKREIVDDYGRLSSWGIEENKRDCCKWEGVYCNNRTNHVTRLDLRAPSENGYWSNTPLQGKMISPSLLELQYLTYLDLSLNEFNGAPIPEYIGSFKDLQYLNLSNCYFISGSIPHHIGNLSKLQFLDFDHTYLDSRDLEWLSHLHDLKYLNLNSVNLSMATNWLQLISSLDSIKELHSKGTYLPEILPSSFPLINTSASTLVVLDLSRNFNISSSTFHWFLNFSSRLTFIDLRYNSLHSIPNALDKMMSLEYLDLSDNLLEGGLPKSFGNMSNLIHLDLSRNHLSGQISELMMNLSGPVETKLQYIDLSWNYEMMSGSFPDVIKFSSLKELRLRICQLKGSISPQNLRLPNLVFLDLSENNLTGPLPDLSFSTSLKFLYLYYNKFNGSLNKSIGGLSKLEELDLGSNLLEGTITEEHLFNLSQLRRLDLSSNSLLKLKFSYQWVPPFQLQYLILASCELGPQFPKWIPNQKELIWLDISNARISDTIPTWFADLSIKLEYLNASNNQIIGSFPKITHNSTYLPFVASQTVDLSRNKVSGSVNFLCYYPILGLVDLSDNQLSNKLPECFENFQRLAYLNLADNNLSGNIPDSLGSLSALSLLHLRNNSFSGGIPASMKNCRKLRMIDLGENRLTGKIPSWIGDGFSDLALLSLRSNELFGSIPTSICSLPTLQILDFSSNNISGPIPKCLSNLTIMTSAAVQYDEFNIRYPFVAFEPQSIRDLSSLESAYFMWKGAEVKYVNVKNLALVKLVDLSNNNLAGEIPTEITKLDDLIGLNLSRNNLIGSIPQNISEMKALDFLDLSRNDLSGGIPTSLSELSQLGILNLSYNNLSGRIPQNSHMLTFEEWAYAGNAGLCGRPLNKSCPGDDPKLPNFNSKHEEDNDDKLISQGFYIAMGAGFVIGFWGIFGTILFNKSVRFLFVKVLNKIEDCVYVRVELSKAHLRRHFQN